MHRILIIAPTFYPDPVVAGIRVTQWARHLPEFGWQPLVVTRHRGYTLTDEQIAADLHPDLQIEYIGPKLATPPKAEASSPGNRRSLRGLAIRAIDFFSVPDPSVWKWRSLAPQAIEIAKRWRPDLVLSSSPPHSIHVMGRRVAQGVGVPWVADFRDPYLIDYRCRPTGVRKIFLPLHRRYEQSIYRDASLIVHAIPLHARWAAQRFPEARSKIRTLTNGIPARLLEGDFLQPIPTSTSQRISIRTVGVLQPSAVATIAAAMSALVERGFDVEFRHVGHTGNSAVAVPSKLGDRFQLLGPVRHDEALREVAGADILLNFLDEERSKVHGLSSKLFEYLAVGRPIVVVNPTISDRHLIARFPWCESLHDPQPQALAAALENAIVNRPAPSAEWLAAYREDFSRRGQTRQLAKWLDDVAPRGREKTDSYESGRANSPTA